MTIVVNLMQLMLRTQVVKVHVCIIIMVVNRMCFISFLILTPLLYPDHPHLVVVCVVLYT